MMCQTSGPAAGTRPRTCGTTRPSGERTGGPIESGDLLQAPLQPCAVEEPNREVGGGDHGEDAKECPLGGRCSMQVVKTAEHIEATHHEQRAGDAERQW